LKCPDESSPVDEQENFRERFCEGTFKTVVLPEDGFEVLKEKGFVMYADCTSNAILDCCENEGG